MTLSVVNAVVTCCFHFDAFLIYFYGTSFTPMPWLLGRFRRFLLWQACLKVDNRRHDYWSFLTKRRDFSRGGHKRKMITQTTFALIDSFAVHLFVEIWCETFGNSSSCILWYFDVD